MQGPETILPPRKSNTNRHKTTLRRILLGLRSETAWAPQSIRRSCRSGWLSEGRWCYAESAWRPGCICSRPQMLPALAPGCRSPYPWRPRRRATSWRTNTRTRPCSCETERSTWPCAYGAADSSWAGAGLTWTRKARKTRWLRTRRCWTPGHRALRKYPSDSTLSANKWRPRALWQPWTERRRWPSVRRVRLRARVVRTPRMTVAVLNASDRGVELWTGRKIDKLNTGEKSRPGRIGRWSYYEGKVSKGPRRFQIKYGYIDVCTYVKS